MFAPEQSQALALMPWQGCVVIPFPMSFARLVGKACPSSDVCSGAQSSEQHCFAEGYHVDEPRLPFRFFPKIPARTLLRR